MCKRIWLIISAFLLLAGCNKDVEDIVLAPTPREITLPSELPEELASRKIYWQGHLMHLDGTLVEFDPITQLDNEASILLSYKFSHNGRYLVYRYDDIIFDDSNSFPGFPGLLKRIGLWNLKTGERKVLVEVEKDFSTDAMLGGIVFTPDDEKVLFAVLWRDDQEEKHVDLATVDIANGTIEKLGLYPLQVYSSALDISPDGKWIALAETSTLSDQVCLLVNLERKTLKCLKFERGWYLSTRFTPDSNYIIYSQSIKGRNSLYRSKIDGMENTLLVSGLLSADILLINENDIVFSGAPYKNYKCSNIYIINQDGSNFRQLSYLGENCLTDK
ncbi:MAG: hypothetical protein QGD88_02930 [Anaerolineae bacterium]|nr:hypothetical protein [Anaerolineae bacterium]